MRKCKQSRLGAESRVVGNHVIERGDVHSDEYCFRTESKPIAIVPDGGKEIFRPPVVYSKIEEGL